MSRFWSEIDETLERRNKDLEKLSDILDARRRGWLPIETAPKDGNVLLYDDSVIWVGTWKNKKRIGDYLYNPTHWQPLPEPPEMNDE